MSVPFTLQAAVFAVAVLHAEDSSCQESAVVFTGLVLLNFVLSFTNAAKRRHWKGLY